MKKTYMHLIINNVSKLSREFKDFPLSERKKICDYFLLEETGMAGIMAAGEMSKYTAINAKINAMTILENAFEQHFNEIANEYLRQLEERSKKKESFFNAIRSYIFDINIIKNYAKNNSKL